MRKDLIFPDVDLTPDETPVIYLDTYAIIGHTTFCKGRKRIEISQHLRDYPELYRFVLAHEIEHSKYRLITWRHFWIDTRDRIKLYWDPTYQKQFRDFQEHLATDSIEEYLFQLAYQLFGVFQALFIVMPVVILRQSINLIRWINRKRKK